MKPPITHKKGSHSLPSGSGRTQINQRGGCRPGSGAPAGNGNAKKALTWLPSFNLSSPEGVRDFLRQVIKATWEGRLGTRAASAINGTISLLLDHEVLPELDKRLKALEEGRGAEG